MTPNELNSLRKEVKKLMIDAELDSKKLGAMSILAESLSGRMERRISRNTLAMALSGFRETEGYQAILKELRDMLAESLDRCGGGMG